MRVKHVFNKMKSTNKYLMFLVGVMSLFVLGGCSDSESHEDISNTDSQPKNTSAIEAGAVNLADGESQVLTFHPENELKTDNSYYSYSFSGFPDDKRIQFELMTLHNSKTIYYPANIGFKFTLKQLKSMQFEIIDINLEESSLKVRVTKAYE